MFRAVGLFQRKGAKVQSRKERKLKTWRLCALALWFQTTIIVSRDDVLDHDFIWVCFI